MTCFRANAGDLRFEPPLGIRFGLSLDRPNRIGAESLGLTGRCSKLVGKSRLRLGQDPPDLCLALLFRRLQCVAQLGLGGRLLLGHRRRESSLGASLGDLEPDREFSLHLTLFNLEPFDLRAILRQFLAVALDQVGPLSGQVRFGVRRRLRYLGGVPPGGLLPNSLDPFVHNLRDYSREEPTHALDASLVLEPTLAEIADSLNATGSCWRLSTEDAERPYHRTMREVTRVELQRSAWLIEGLRLLTQRPTLKKSNRNLGGILDQVFQLTKPQRRLDGVRLLANLSDTSVMIPVDERLGVLAYAGMLQATLALVRHLRGAVVRCELSNTPTAAVVMFSHDSVTVPDPLVDRFFDETFHSRPGGAGAAVTLAVTKRVMELHGGTTAVHSMEPMGFRVSAQIPTVGGRSEG